MAPKIYHCSRCGEKIPWKPDPSGKSSLPEHFPFCSERCRLVDLGKWIDGDYNISEPLPSSQDMESDSDRPPEI